MSGLAETPPFDWSHALSRARSMRGDEAAQLGIRALGERRELEALPVLQAVAAGPWQTPAALHVLGLLYRALGDLAQALAALDDALAITPNVPRLVHARACAALEAGVPSTQWFERARALAPNDGDVILGLAAAMLAEQSVQAADHLLGTTLRQHPGWMPGHTAIARLRFANGRTADFLEELDRAIATAPQDSRLWHMKIMALHRAALPQLMEEALSSARRELGSITMLAAADAIAATEYRTRSAADAAFERVDPFSDPDLAVHWFRHLLRRKEPERIVTSGAQVPRDMRAAVAPYMTLAKTVLGYGSDEPIDRQVRVVDLGENWPHLATLADTLRGLHRTISQPLDQSVRGGTQTDGPLLSRIEPSIVALRARLSGEVEDYIAALSTADRSDPWRGDPPARPRFVGSWSVRLNGGGFHTPHVHLEGWLSSAFYVALPPLGNASRAGWLVLGEPPAALGLDLSLGREIEPRPGRLVLFPSTMWHSTRTFGSGERLTVAFDVG